MNKDSGNAIIQCKPTQSSRPAIIATDWNLVATGVFIWAAIVAHKKRYSHSLGV
jgi:hypothetical protein